VLGDMGTRGACDYYLNIQRDPTLTVTAPAHDGYDIKMDPSLNAVLANQEQDKWKSPKFMASAYDLKWLGQTWC
jgi:hypothetical protein